MGTSSWYSADLTFDGKILSKISDGSIVEDFTKPLWRTATKQEIESCVLNIVKRNITE